MAIVKNLVEAFNGNIDVSSVIGQGTTISIDLKLPYSNDSDAKEANDVFDRSHVENKRILVVDDIELNRIIIKRPLLASGAIVLEASAASEAIEKISALATNAESLDLVITDLNMPGSSGLDLVEQSVRTIERYRS